jgi:hypothetical protein
MSLLFVCIILRIFRVAAVFLKVKVKILKIVDVLKQKYVFQHLSLVCLHAL